MFFISALTRLSALPHTTFFHPAQDATAHITKGEEKLAGCPGPALWPVGWAGAILRPWRQAQDVTEEEVPAPTPGTGLLGQRDGQEPGEFQREQGRACPAREGALAPGWGLRYIWALAGEKVSMRQQIPGCLSWTLNCLGL